MALKELTLGNGLAFCVVIFVTCLLAGLGMGSPMGALVPAFGWVLASFLLTMPTAAGEWRVQAASNRQGSAGLLDAAAGAALSGAETEFQRQARALFG